MYTGKIAIARLAAPTVCLLFLAGCHQDMWNQPRYTALQPSGIFENGMSSRPIPEGTVEFGKPRLDEHYYTGKIDGEFAAGLPPQIELNDELLNRGQLKFGIYCAPCHGLTGMGDGMIVQRGMKQPPSYHIDRLKAMPVGYFFDVMTNGFGQMYSYASRVTVEDRWAIAAYTRALQLTQAPFDQLPEEAQEKVTQPPQPEDQESHDNHGQH